MKKIILVAVSVFCFLFQGNLFAQESEKTTSEEKEKLPEAAFILKFSPQALFDFLSPAFQLAGEYPISDRFSLQHEIGLIMGNSTEYNDVFGYRLRQEGRFYISPLSKKLCRGPYMGVDVLYKRQNNGEDNVRIDHLDPITGVNLYSEIVKKKLLDTTLGFHFKIGAQHVFTDSKSFFNRVIFDWSLGYGVRKTIDLSPNSDFMGYKEGLWQRSFSINARIGYMFVK